MGPHKVVCATDGNKVTWSPWGREGIYCILAYFTFIQHKILKIVCKLEVISFSVDLTSKLGLKIPDHITRGHFEMDRQQSYRGQVSYVGWMRGTFLCDNSLSPSPWPPINKGVCIWSDFGFLVLNVLVRELLAPTTTACIASSVRHCSWLRGERGCVFVRVDIVFFISFL